MSQRVDKNPEDVRKQLAATQWVLRHIVNGDNLIKDDPLAIEVLKYAFEQPEYTPSKTEELQVIQSFKNE